MQLIYVTCDISQKEEAKLQENRCACHTILVAATLLVVLRSLFCSLLKREEMSAVSDPCPMPPSLNIWSNPAPRQPDELDPPGTSHTKGRNTTGTSGDLQNAKFCPRLRWSHLLTNRLSVTPGIPWHPAGTQTWPALKSLPSLKISKKGYCGPNYFSSANSVTFYSSECAHTHIRTPGASFIKMCLDLFVDKMIISKSVFDL